MFSRFGSLVAASICWVPPNFRNVKLTSSETHKSMPLHMECCIVLLSMTVMEKRGLWKRAITGAAKGIAAVAKLLTGATKVATSSKPFRAYRKNGNYETTQQDFYSVEPRLTKAKQFGGTTGFDFGRRRDSHGSLVGTHGDRRLILRPNGDWYSRHSPVLEIRSITNADYGRIVYKTKGD